MGSEAGCGLKWVLEGKEPLRIFEQIDTLSEWKKVIDRKTGSVTDLENSVPLRVN